MFLGLKVRLYPNKMQKEIIDNNIKASRYVYNYFLKYANDYEIYDINVWKKELFILVKSGNNAILNNACYFSMTKELYILNNAFDMYFKKKTNKPQYKSEFNRNVAYNVSNKNTEIKIMNNRIEVKDCGLIKCRCKKDLSNKKIFSIAIKKKMDNYYEASLLYMTTIQFFPKTYRKVGIDLGVRKLITTSNNEKFFNVEELDHIEEMIKINQRKLSNMVKKSSNWYKQKKRIEKIHLYKSNYIKDNINKITTHLIKKYDVIYMEDLSTNDLFKIQFNKRIRRKILESSFQTIRDTLVYKAKMYGKKVIFIDKFYPSTQICSECGFKHDPLDKETFICPVCGLEIDRDYNAAINILNIGEKINNSGACSD